MDNLKKKNPNANWANLLTGVAVLVMVTVFSYAYFTKADSINAVRDEEEILGTAREDVDIEEADVTEEEVPAGTKSDTTIAQKGEGLWHVAQRVCGDGEKYNILAQANNLNVWEELNEGMTLKVVCD